MTYEDLEKGVDLKQKIEEIKADFAALNDYANPLHAYICVGCYVIKSQDEFFRQYLIKQKESELLDLQKQFDSINNPKQTICKIETAAAEIDDALEMLDKLCNFLQGAETAAACKKIINRLQKVHDDLLLLILGGEL